MSSQKEENENKGKTVKSGYIQSLSCHIAFLFVILFIWSLTAVFLNPSEIETQRSHPMKFRLVSSLLSIIKTIDLGMEKSFPLKWRDGIEINPQP